MYEDGRQGNDDRLRGKKQCTSRQEGLFLLKKPEFNAIDKRYVSLLNKQYYTISVFIHFSAVAKVSGLPTSIRL